MTGNNIIFRNRLQHKNISGYKLEAALIALFEGSVGRRPAHKIVTARPPDGSDATDRGQEEAKECHG
ncbi:MAG: hypothetical protein F4Y62_03355 [Rhodospirillaceae bacterium]|nr:hypothetical protein [Rhodospirillaceae bacterium]